jgi:hypothetical protein
MLNVQKFLREGGTLEQLAQAPYHITAKPHPDYPNLYLLKYDQLSSEFSDPIVCECRGLILDSTNDWNVVCYSFSKFFNAEEPLASPIDWASARVQLKADGSLMQVYHYNNLWNVASSGTPNASGQVNGFPITFAELFWEVFFSSGLALDDLDKNSTFVFELTTTYNMIVVRHKENRLTLIGVRDNTTLVEYPVSYWDEVFPTVQEYQLDSIKAINDALKDMNGLEQEGFVVVDSQFRRIKCKSSSYVQFHHLKDSLGATPKRMVDIIRKGESVEFLSYFEEFRELHDTYRAKFEALIGDNDEVFERMKLATNGNRKLFAFTAKTTLIPAFHFARLDGRTPNVRTWLKDLSIDKLMELLEKT